jgi:hypothetical protein
MIVQEINWGAPVVTYCAQRRVTAQRREGEDGEGEGKKEKSGGGARKKKGKGDVHFYRLIDLCAGNDIKKRRRKKREKEKRKWLFLLLIVLPNQVGPAQTR